MAAHKGRQRVLEPTCRYHRDCFARSDWGTCRILKDMEFKGRSDCPFYKTEGEYNGAAVRRDIEAYAEKHGRNNTTGSD